MFLFLFLFFAILAGCSELCVPRRLAQFWQQKSLLRWALFRILPTKKIYERFKRLIMMRVLHVDDRKQKSLRKSATLSN